MTLKEKESKQQKKQFFYQKPKLESDENTSKKKDRFIEIETKTITQAGNLENWIEFILLILEKKGLLEAVKAIEGSLKAIPQEETIKRSSIWKLRVNLELQQDNDESLLEVINEVSNTSSAKEVLRHLLDCLIEKGQFSKAEYIAKKLQKCFKERLYQWLILTELYIKQRQTLEQLEFDQVRSTYLRAIQSIDQQDHQEFQTKYALQEYQYGDMEKGRSEFEKLLDKNPRKNLIWNLYIDMEIKYGKDLAKTREIFNRVVSLPHKRIVALGFFKKFLNFEVSFGDKKTQNHVKELA